MEKRNTRIEMSDSEVFLHLYYRAFTAVQMCVFVKFDIKPLGLGGESVVGVVGLGGVDGCLGVLEGERYVYKG